MASEVLYGRTLLKPYFNLQKFEDTIYNKPKIRAERIKRKRRIRILDKSLVLACIILFLILSAYITAIVMEQVKIYHKTNEIKKLESMLSVRKKENAVRMDAIKSEIKFDDLKMKAYMEFNMVTPTEKSIIYFDKTDNGFVRQYEDIR